MSKTFSALKIRNYRLFAIGRFVSSIGSWMQRNARNFKSSSRWSSRPTAP